ncbi:MAG: hypothetical protein WBW73_31425 [Rhodoplanes sp.]
MVQTNNAFTTTDGPGVIPAAAQFTPVEVAHLHLVAAFKEMTLHRAASGRADAVDLERRLSRVQDVLKAVHTHVDAVVAPAIIDTNHLHSPVLVGYAEEFIGEFERCSALFRSAEDRSQGRGASS